MLAVYRLLARVRLVVLMYLVFTRMPKYVVVGLFFIFYSRQNKDTKNRYVLINKLQLIGDELIQLGGKNKKMYGGRTISLR